VDDFAAAEIETGETTNLSSRREPGRRFFLLRLTRLFLQRP
jgi:hypothetical protein